MIGGVNPIKTDYLPKQRHSAPFANPVGAAGTCVDLTDMTEGLTGAQAEYSVTSK